MPRRIGVDWVSEKQGYGLFQRVKGSKQLKLVFNSHQLGDVLRYVINEYDLADELFIPELICYATSVEVNHENDLMNRFEEKHGEAFDPKSKIREIWQVEKYINSILATLAGKGDLRITVGDLANATGPNMTKETENKIEDMLRDMFGFGKDTDEKKGEE